MKGAYKYSVIDDEIYLKALKETKRIRRGFEDTIDISTSKNESRTVRVNSETRYVYERVTCELEKLRELNMNEYAIGHLIRSISLKALSAMHNSVLHIFIETPELSEFLRTTKINDKDEGITRWFGVINTPPTISNSHKNHHGPKPQLEQRVSFAIHFPNENQSMLCLFSKMIDDKYSEFDESKWYFSFSYKGSTYIARMQEDDKLTVAYLEDCDGWDECFSIAMNLLSYIECFPDKFTEDVSELQIGNSSPTARKCIIKTEQSLLDYGSDGAKRPHLRKGYFKRCTSDYYTNMKGKTIFVRSTFVKGTAKVVLE